MKYYADLHIHSNVSPCCDDDMTPNDLIAMAKIKGLDIIAVTDHNTCFNLPAIQKIVERDNGILVIPGVEVTTSEDIHILCYFYSFEDAIAFSDELYDHIPPFKNKNNIFGNQIIMDENDEVVRIEEKLLVTGVDLDIMGVIKMCKDFGGVCVPAHVNKQSNSIIMTLGMIPKECGFKTIEVHRKSEMPNIDLSEYQVTYSSDAHNLMDISERDFTLDLEEKSIKAVLDYLKNE